MSKSVSFGYNKNKVVNLNRAVMVIKGVKRSLSV